MKGLNVGCGAEARLHGWVNVDAMEITKPDVCCDGKVLPFPDATFDQILASHVLEHENLWEGRDFLNECRRVIKPNGALVVRVPDARNILTCYVTKVHPPAATMIPASKDMNLCDLDIINHLFVYSSIQKSPHRWFYDLETLARQLAVCGFVYQRALEPREWWEICIAGSPDPDDPETWEELHAKIQG